MGHDCPIAIKVTNMAKKTRNKPQQNMNHVLNAWDLLK